VYGIQWAESEADVDINNLHVYNMYPSSFFFYPPPLKKKKKKEKRI
jgi:hypothetical protein